MSSDKSEFLLENERFLGRVCSFDMVRLTRRGQQDKINLLDSINQVNALEGQEATDNGR